MRMAHGNGPQHVTLHGRDAVVVVDADEFNRLKGTRTGESLVSALQAPPHREIEFESCTLCDARAGGQVVSGWLLDTHVISELRRPRPSARVRTSVCGHWLTVVTRDTDDYKLARVPLIDPWVDEWP